MPTQVVLPQYIFCITKSNWCTSQPVLQSVSLPHIVCCFIVVCLPASQGSKILVGEDTHTYSKQLSYNMQKKTTWQTHDIGMCNRFSCVKLNFCPWPFETLRSITVTVESTHSAVSLKHGFRSHRMLNTGQKKKLHCQWDLHRLVRGKTTHCGRQTFHLPSLVSFWTLKLYQHHCEDSKAANRSVAMSDITRRIMQWICLRDLALKEIILHWPILR